MGGVQRGYKYTMKLVYAHFPINVNPTDGGKSLEIRNFLGEKVIRRVPMKEGVKVDKTGNKDEIALEGNSIENVGSSALSSTKCAWSRGRISASSLMVCTSVRRVTSTPSSLSSVSQGSITGVSASEGWRSSCKGDVLITLR